MNIKLNLKQDTCIKCAKCVMVCPSKIFTQTNPKSSVELAFPESCIACGHCVSVCPTLSISHTDFPQEKIHEIDYSLLPTPEQVLLLCKLRRSNRAFSQEPIPMPFLDLILEAAHRAPTASNQQQVAFTLITNPEQLQQITNFTLRVFSSVLKKVTNPLLKPILKCIMPDVYKYLPAFERLLKARENGEDLILRKATVVLFIHTPKSSRFGCQDANLAYQNASLMAESLGVNQFYTGFVCSATKQAKGGDLAKQLGIEGTIHAGMALGMPAFKYPRYMDKKEIMVDKIV